MTLSKTSLLLLCYMTITLTSDPTLRVEKDEDFTHPKDRFIPQKGQIPPLPLLNDDFDMDDFLIGVIENFREDMIIGIPDLKVPVLDPFQPPKPIKVDVEDGKASIQGNFTNISVEGLSGFVLNCLNADLKNLSLTFGFRIPRIFAKGDYFLNGKIIKIIPVRGDGPFWVESHNLTLAASASMFAKDDGHLQLSSEPDIDVDFEKVEMHFENFLGGGRWTEVLMKILSDVSKDLFRKFLPLLKKELGRALLKEINKALAKLPITGIVTGGTPNEYVDLILLNVRNLIRDKGYDPMELPNFNKNFSKEIMFVTVHGEAKLHDGWLWGISSISRTDECQLKSNRTTITVSAHLGLTDLKLHYKGHAKFMNWGPSIECGGSVSTVSFYFSIEQSNVRGAKPKINDFEVVELSTIWIELSGLGPLTWIMKWLLTGISKLVEDFLVEKFTVNLRVYLEGELDKVGFPVF